MRDRVYVRDDGTEVPVARMSDEELDHAITRGFECLDDQAERPAIWERLRIERLIRDLEL